MALPSQGGFSSTRSGSYRRRRKRGNKIWLGLLAIAIVAVWIMWPGGKQVEGIEATIEVATQEETTIPIATPPVYQNQPAVPIHAPAKQTSTQRTNTTSEPNQLVDQVAQKPSPKTTEVAVAKESTIHTIPLAATISLNLEEGMQYLDKGQLTQARLKLSNTLRSGTLTDSEVAQAKGVLADISDTLVFSRSITSNDPFAIEYIVRGGDTLSGIVHSMGLQVDWRFVQRINGISHASSIRPGQSIKLITGPFHAIVDKATYRMDVYLGEGNDQVFVRSYRVGLGEFDSTPTGLFQVRRNSKLVNPTWINPRTREFYSADNPDNPIGERWIGLQGIDAHIKDHRGLGIHGTIEPHTIGTQASMGCIRMHAGDVTEVYEMLGEDISTVRIK